MLSEKGRRALADILANAVLAVDFLEGHSPASFASDTRTLYAVTRCLEIVSEASRRVDAATIERHPGIPWRQMADAGNVYRHGYDSVSPQRLWHTVRDRLPDLITVCRIEMGG